MGEFGWQNNVGAVNHGWVFADGEKYYNCTEQGTKKEKKTGYTNFKEKDQTLQIVSKMARNWSKIRGRFS